MVLAAPDMLNDAAPEVEATSTTPPARVRSEFDGAMVTVPDDSLGTMTPKARSPPVSVVVFLEAEIAVNIVAVALASVEAASASFPEKSNAKRLKRAIILFLMGNLPFNFHDGGFTIRKEIIKMYNYIITSL